MENQTPEPCPFCHRVTLVHGLCTVCGTSLPRPVPLPFETEIPVAFERPHHTGRVPRARRPSSTRK